MRFRPHLRATLAATVLAAATVTPLLTAPAASAAPAKLADDFNGDGYRDLVMQGGEYRTDRRVTVLYGTSAGPGTRVQTIHQDSTGIPGAVESGDDWGYAATTADLDRDGYADLVVASPGENVGDVSGRGGLTVVWGSATGLGSGTVFHSPIAPVDNEGDRLGYDLASGDFDGDGDPDLAATSSSSAGVVLLKGPFTRTGGKQGWTSLGGSYGYLSAQHLVAGRVTNDSATDLYVIGDDLGDDDSTHVSAFFHRGGADFATRAGRIDYADDGGGGVGSSGPQGAIGDFDKDGYGDLAFGRGLENADGMRGYVKVKYGSATGPSTTRASATFHQDTTGVPGAREAGDYFGSAVAAGDVNGDGYADLAIGASGEDLGSVRDAGTVTVLLGRAGGLSGTGAKAYDQNTSGVAGGPEADDYFGVELKLTDYTRDGRTDLIVGTGDQVSDVNVARFGLIHQLNGSSTGTTGTGSRAWSVVSLKLPYERLGGPFAR
ncbi:FG-GAP and VCBS repeat-containing protein [Streptomyces polyrhachis]|uniref:FG-GAP and VCBS repeat-containing protein n=1 Tax=Streptomyces polyrhachis TaxID=1282885 RepID=A0ABW2GB42_9ACTN